MITGQVYPGYFFPEFGHQKVIQSTFLEAATLSFKNNNNNNTLSIFIKKYSYLCLHILLFCFPTTKCSCVANFKPTSLHKPPHKQLVINHMGKCD